MDVGAYRVGLLKQFGCTENRCIVNAMQVESEVFGKGDTLNSVRQVYI